MSDGPVMDGLACFFCLDVSSTRIALDKRKKPFLYCCACGARTFLPSHLGVAGIAVLEPLAKQIGASAAEHQDVRNRYQSTLDAFVERMRAALVEPAIPRVVLPPRFVSKEEGSGGIDPRDPQVKS